MWFFSRLLIASSIFLSYTLASEKSELKLECDKNYSANCLKLDIVNWIDKINNKEGINVFPGLSIVKENLNGRANTVDEVTDVNNIDSFLLKKVYGFLSTHSFKVNLLDKDNSEARGKGGKKGGGGGMGNLFAAAAMIKSAYLAIALGALAALAGKALMTSLIALVLSAIVGLKSLIGGGGGESTYEVISKPVYTHSSSHSSGHEDHHGHRRSFDSELPLGLQQGYKPA